MAKFICKHPVVKPQTPNFVNTAPCGGADVIRQYAALGKRGNYNTEAFAQDRPIT